MKVKITATPICPASHAASHRPRRAKELDIGGVRIALAPPIAAAPFESGIATA